MSKTSQVKINIKYLDCIIVNIFHKALIKSLKLGLSTPLPPFCLFTEWGNVIVWQSGIILKIVEDNKRGAGNVMKSDLISDEADHFLIIV